jgi:hypothetical protein
VFDGYLFRLKITERMLGMAMMAGAIEAPRLGEQYAQTYCAKRENGKSERQYLARAAGTEGFLDDFVIGMVPMFHFFFRKSKNTLGRSGQNPLILGKLARRRKRPAV